MLDKQCKKGSNARIIIIWLSFGFSSFNMSAADWDWSGVGSWTLTPPLTLYRLTSFFLIQARATVLNSRSKNTTWYLKRDEVIKDISSLYYVEKISFSKRTNTWLKMSLFWYFLFCLSKDTNWEGRKLKEENKAIVFFFILSHREV